ncbi:MAG: carboxypeptidase-like regulatory domain-containing protein, partial [Candidatus Uhrbacteria bacterium]|nr:carboxypeptidase-like regulatory domain-containing protein [Candidatus Uhrbacteria bacterium]
VVYNSITKVAIDLVIVRLFEKASNRLIETQVTDKSGRFSFLAPPGEYYITATKNPLAFPSHIVRGSIDGDYANIYRQESFSIATPDQVMTLSVPLDPPAFDHARVAQRFHLIKWWKTFVGKNPLAPLLVGFLISEVLVLYIPNSVNYTLLWFNGFFLITQMALGLKSEKEWGLVFDAVSLAPIPLAAITIFDAQEGKMLRTRLTDYFGRFSFLTPTGKYLLAVNKDGYQFPVPKDMHIAKYHHLYYGESFDVKGKRALVKTNIPVMSKGPEPSSPQEAVVPQPSDAGNVQGHTPSPVEQSQASVATQEAAVPSQQNTQPLEETPPAQSGHLPSV